MRIPNISVLHRAIRIGLGLVIALVGVNVLNGPPAICSAIFGSVIALSGVFGYCPACAALKNRS
jgi:hypothetical protein